MGGRDAGAPPGRRRVRSPRPTISVIVPYLGDSEAGAAVLERMSGMTLRPGDELICADNSATGVLVRLAERGAHHPLVVPAAAVRSSYYARNRGAEAAAGEWLLFLDADCRPASDLLDAFLQGPPGPGCGALSGRILADARQAALLARYARARRFMNFAAASSASLDRDSGVEVAAGGNLLVRRAAFEAIGGFRDRIRSGGDVDLCRRLRGAGWTIGERPAATVIHPARERLLPFLATVARYGAGSRWLDADEARSTRHWPLRPAVLGAAAVEALRRVMAGEREEAAYRAIDGLSLIAHNVGYRSGNRAPVRRLRTTRRRWRSH